MKTYLTYGFAMAAASALLMAVLYLLGLHSDPAKLNSAQWVAVSGGVAISATCIALGIKARRAQVPAWDEFGYGRAFGHGFMVALVGSCFGIGTTILYATVINPEFTDVVVQAQVEQLEARGMSAAQLENAERMIRKMTTPGVQAVFGFIGGLMMGTVISAIVAAFLKRPAAPEPAAAPVTQE